MKRLVRHQAVPYVAAFGLPFAICVMICIGNGVYPFGNNCILHIDMYHQYCPFFTEFLDKLRSGGSLQYSWNLGLGSDFVSLYAYYLASPLNFFIIFCPKKYVIEFMTLLVLLKIALCGLSFFLFLKYRYHLVGKDGKLHSNQVVPALIFSTAYALSGFVAAYSWDIMWMDCIALFPLILLGLERLVLKQQPGMYYVTLAVSIFANYYISIMICIFLVFYFFYLLLLHKGHRLAAILRFGWYSALAGASSAILLLPEIALLGASGSASDSFPQQVEWYFNLLAEFGRGAVTASVYTGNDHWPNLYAGVFTLILAWIYLLNRRISWKEKLPPVLMLAFLLVSFANNQLDFIWHGMHFPQSLPGRESFVYILILLCMGFAAVRKWKGTRIWQIIVATVVTLALLLGTFFVGDEDVTEPVSLVITGLFVLLYGIVMLLTKLTSKQIRYTIKGFIVCVVIGELAANMAVTGLGVTSRVSYTEKREAYETLLEQAKEDNGKDGFYRVEDTGRKTKNDSALYDYSSATIFSSLMNLDVSHLYQSLYMEGGKNFYSYNGATPLTSAMLSVRYMLSDNPMEESAVRTLVASSNGSYLYRNNYNLPLGYMMPEQAIEAWNVSNSDRVSSLNSLARALGAGGDLIYPFTYTSKEEPGDTTIEILEDGYYYTGYVSCGVDSLTVTRSDGWTQNYNKTTHRYLIELGECEAGTQIHITNTGNETISFHVYRMNFAALDAAYETLQQQTMELTEMTDRKVEGTIEVTEPGRLILSIPADEGWSLYVDGVLTPIETFEDAWIGVSLAKGTHSISLRYTTPGLHMGAAISIGAVLLFLISIFLHNRKRRVSQILIDSEDKILL